MNDARGANDPFDRRTGKAIAQAIIDGLGQDDMAAVVFTRDNRNAQDFTADRSLLRQAIDRFNPMDTVSIRPLLVVGRAQAFLSKMPGYRRAIVFITPQFPTAGAVVGPDLDGADAFGIDEDAEASARDMRVISTGGQVGHVPVYPFSTHGLQAPTVAGLRSGMPWRDATEFDIAMRRIAATTGGRATVSDNAPVRFVPQMFEELGSYYALGFRPSVYALEFHRSGMDTRKGAARSSGGLQSQGSRGGISEFQNLRSSNRQ
jgi:hypothetical protein